MTVLLRGHFLLIHSLAEWCLLPRGERKPHPALLSAPKLHKRSRIVLQRNTSKHYISFLSHPNKRGKASDDVVNAAFIILITFISSMNKGFICWTFVPNVNYNTVYMWTLEHIVSVPVISKSCFQLP